MCCCKKKIEKLEAEVAELEAAINRVSLATCGQPALPSALSEIPAMTASGADAITNAVADSLLRKSDAGEELRAILSR